MKRTLGVEAGSTFETTVRAAEGGLGREAAVQMAELVDDLLSVVSAH